MVVDRPSGQALGASMPAAAMASPTGAVRLVVTGGAMSGA
jgi:hypothetical protein